MKNIKYFLGKSVKKNKYVLIYVVIIFMITIGIVIFGLLSEQIKEIELWETWTTCVATVLVFCELMQNKQINEAQLIKELNNEFINNKELNEVEHKFEIYYAEYQKAGDDKEKKKKIKLDLDLRTEKKDRQRLVNYLVYLEMIAALVNDDILKLNAINDLVAYRFFIALNNPIVQKVELGPYRPYYEGCYKLHKKWTEKKLREEEKWSRRSGNIDNQERIPMEEYGKFFDDQSIQEETKSNEAPNIIEDYIKWFYKYKDISGNPTVYFFNLPKIRENIKKIKQGMPRNVQIYYAMKANPNKDVMKCIWKTKLLKGIEIASAGELERALEYCQGDEIIFTGPGKTEYELEAAIERGIRYINVESITEAVRINKIAEQLGKDHVDILLRVNVNYSAADDAEKMAGYSTKMGIDEDVFIKSFKKIRKLERIRIKGIHAFAASGVLDYRVLIKINQYIFDLVNKIERKLGTIQVIDFGGGLGIDYSTQKRVFNVKQYQQTLDKLINKYKFYKKEIIMELGTYITGNAGYYTAKIIDIKSIKGKKHIIIAGGVNHMGLPLEMRRKHPVRIIPMNEPEVYPNQPRVSSEVVDISGPLCIVSDKLCWNEKIKRADIGDIVVFYQAGAYCYEEGMHEFLMHSLPNVAIFDRH